jgi:hypothetical protein
MTPEHRSALLMLGLFLNEANWLRKLLVGAVQGISDTPEGQASFSLTILIATTLAGKVHEGWNRIKVGWLCNALSDVQLPDTLQELRSKLEAALLPETPLHKIRKNIGFHYPSIPLDFNKLTQHIEDSDAAIFMVPEGYGGDVLSHLSTLAGIEPILAVDNSQDYRHALKAAWNEITGTTGLYCQFVSEVMVSIISQSIPGFRVEDLLIAEVPEVGEKSIPFFVHPPDNLDEMRAEVEAQ